MDRPWKQNATLKKSDRKSNILYGCIIWNIPSPGKSIEKKNRISGDQGQGGTQVANGYEVCFGGPGVGGADENTLN